MEKKSRLDMERGIRRSLLTTDKTEFREIVMTSKVIDKNYIENFYSFDVNLIIYQYGMISSDKIYTINNNENSKEEDEVNSETKQEHEHESSCESSSEPEIPFNDKKVLEAYFLKHK